MFCTETPKGITLTPYDPTFEEQIKLARATMKARQAALRELANDGQQ